MGLTSKGKSHLLAVSRMSLGAGKAVETGSRSVSEESIYAKKKRKGKKKQTGVNSACVKKCIFTKFTQNQGGGGGLAARSGTEFT